MLRDPGSTVFTTPAPRDTWKALVKSDQEALAFQTPEWLDCICEVGRYEDASRLYQHKDGRKLILPMVRRRNVGRMFTSEASLPYGWGFGGLVGEGTTNPEDVDAVFSEFASRSSLRVSVRPNPMAASQWHDRAPAGVAALPRTAHVLDLEGGFEHTWSRRFAGRARTYVRKAERSSLSVESDTTGALVPVFYDLYMRSVERWARQSNVPIAKARQHAEHHEPLRKFTTVARLMGEACRIWLASLDGQPAAAIVVLQQGMNASYWRGAMDEDLAGDTRANYLLHSKAIEDACGNGCKWYHMGETGNSESLGQFKTRFGSKSYDYFEYRFERLPISATRETLIAAKHKLRARLSAN